MAGDADQPLSAACRKARGTLGAPTCSGGQPIGRVGYTGNANPAGPHLHFAIMRMNPGEKWWQGSAINPYPLLVKR